MTISIYSYKQFTETCNNQLFFDTMEYIYVILEEISVWKAGLFLEKVMEI